MRCLSELGSLSQVKIGFVEFYDFITPITVLRNFDKSQIEKWKDYFEDEADSYKSFGKETNKFERTEKKEYRERVF